MKKTRVLLIALATLAILAVPGTAMAKGPSQARLEGPGLPNPITVRGDGEPGSGGNLAELAEQTGLFPAMFGQTPDPMSPTRPPGELGPRFVVTYAIPSETVPDEIHQDLYPHAANGPVTYTQPGQRFFGTEATHGGWFRAPSALTATLAAFGLPTEPPQAVASPVANQANPTRSDDETGTRVPLSRVLLLAAAGLVALAGVGVTWGLKRRHTA
jgi:hypothetical protein